jgi:predicted Zn finger-like uncharacterized protein
MLIICPTCSNSYLIRATEIGPEGRLVRCGSCKNAWQVGGSVTGTGEPAEEAVQVSEIKEENQSGPVMIAAGKPMRPTRRLAIGGLAVAALSTVFIMPFGKIADAARAIMGSVIPADRFAGLDFENVSSQLVAENDQIFLIVEGHVIARNGESRPMPGLALAIRGEERDQIFRWTAKPPAETISTGAPIPFKVRLASPPITGREVIIRFVDASEVGDDSAS